MMLDMGYAEDAAHSALQRCGSVDEAIDLIASEDAQDPRVEVAPQWRHRHGMAIENQSFNCCADGWPAVETFPHAVAFWPHQGGGTHCTFQQQNATGSFSQVWPQIPHYMTHNYLQTVIFAQGQKIQKWILEKIDENSVRLKMATRFTSSQTTLRRSAWLIAWWLDLARLLNLKGWLNWVGRWVTYSLRYLLVLEELRILREINITKAGTFMACW